MKQTSIDSYGMEMWDVGTAVLGAWSCLSRGQLMDFMMMKMMIVRIN